MRLDEARDLLGVRAGASRQEVDRRFREAARRHHPDAGGDSELFRRLVVARATLIERHDRPPLVVIPDRRWWHPLLSVLRLLTRRRLVHRSRGAR